MLMVYIKLKFVQQIKNLSSHSLKLVYIIAIYCRPGDIIDVIW